MNWIKRKYYALQLLLAAMYLGDATEQQAQLAELFGEPQQRRQS